MENVGAVLQFRQWFKFDSNNWRMDRPVYGLLEPTQVRFMCVSHNVWSTYTVPSALHVYNAQRNSYTYKTDKVRYSHKTDIVYIGPKTLVPPCTL